MEDLLTGMERLGHGIREQLRETARNVDAMASDDALVHEIAKVATACVTALRSGRKVLFAGNGGSAADAQHLAAELVSRFAYDRPGLPAFALTTDTSVLTAIGNDYGYERLFARQIEAVGVAGDVFFGISTSGRSPNVLHALDVARTRRLVTVGLTGRSGGEMASRCDHLLRVPSDATPRIQEGHIAIGHVVCQLIEAELFPEAGVTESIVLAGGLGTRLRSVVNDLPKPMAPVRGRPFLSFVLDRLVDAGLQTAILAVGYRYEAIQSHFGESYRGLALRYSVETEPLGTGGAIRLACEKAMGGDIFVMNGDTYVELDLDAMLRAHVDRRRSLTMAICHVPDAARYGALDLADDRARGFAEKGRSGPGWINAGTYLFGQALRELFPPRPAFSFEHDLLARRVDAIRPLAFRSAGPFIDIGTPDDYDRAERLLPAR